MESIEKLRTAARNMAKGRNLENHEECNLLLVIADAIEREIAEHYMLLPVDADGVTIHVGDVMHGAHNKPERDVVAVGDGLFVCDGLVLRPSHKYHHVKPDPIKELLEDYAGKRFARSNMDLDIKGLADDYAAKIREAVRAE